MIEVNSNVLFLSTFGVKIDVKNERKRVSRMCENAYLSIKNPKASRALEQALDPSRRLPASLARLRFATSATFDLRSWAPPLTKSWIRTCFTQGNQLKFQRPWNKFLHYFCDICLTAVIVTENCLKIEN